MAYILFFYPVYFKSPLRVIFFKKHIIRQPAKYQRHNYLLVFRREYCIFLLEKQALLRIKKVACRYHFDVADAEKRNLPFVYYKIIAYICI